MVNTDIFTSERKPQLIHESALRDIEKHASSSPSREVGGVLLGNIFSSNGTHYLRIDDCLAAKCAEENQSSLTFTYETWSQLNTERERKRPELKIVGWYHTHPGLGVFLSNQDLFIHKNFFHDQNMVALVVDPKASSRALFHWSGNKVVKSPGFYIFGDATRSREIEELGFELQQVRQVSPPPE